LSIVTADEETLDFGLDGPAHSKDLLERLREEIVVKRQLPRLLETLAAGESVKFGSEEPLPVNDAGGLAIDSQGITLPNSKRRISWNELFEVGSSPSVVQDGKH